MSWTLGRIWGIPIQLHWSFLLVLPLFAFLIGEAYFAGPAGATVRDYVWGAVLAVALFASVIAHELGHSWTAQRYDVPIEAIVLLPIGGVSKMERMPDEPRQEMWVALAGPVVSFAVGLPILAIHFAGLVPAIDPDLSTFVFWAGGLNVFLGAFNLFVPAFPMDGGRVLRAGLTERLGRRRATEVAGTIGKALAVAMGVAGFLTLSGGGWLLLLVAIFIYMGANQEVDQVRAQFALGDLTVADAMTTDVTAVSATDSLAEVHETMRATRHLAFPVVEAGRVVGMIGLEQVSEVPVQERSSATVRDAMRPEVGRLAPEAAAREALERLAGRDERMLVVEDASGLVGVVTRTDLVRLVKILESG